jgi:hypothetical protein
MTSVHTSRTCHLPTVRPWLTFWLTNTPDIPLYAHLDHITSNLTLKIQPTAAKMDAVNEALYLELRAES